MKTIEWVRREIELACKNETEKCKANPYYQEGDEEYGILCYKAAGELMEVFEEQGHSGYSAGITAQIFKRLVDGKPLTPITDEDDQWDEIRSIGHEHACYQHIRMGSLFKTVLKDGSTVICDGDRVQVCYEGYTTSFLNSFVNQIVSEQFPIEFPYVGETLKAQCEGLEGKKGYPALKAIITVMKDDKIYPVYRYFMEKNYHEEGWFDPPYIGWIEISKAKYDELKAEYEEARKA